MIPYQEEKENELGDYFTPNYLMPFVFLPFIPSNLSSTSNYPSKRMATLRAEWSENDKKMFGLHKKAKNITVAYDRYNVLLNSLKLYKTYPNKDINIKFMKVLPNECDTKTTTIR